MYRFFMFLFCVITLVMFVSCSSDSGDSGSGAYSIEFFPEPSRVVEFLSNSNTEAPSGDMVIIIRKDDSPVEGAQIHVTTTMNDSANSLITDSQRNTFSGISYKHLGGMHATSYTANDIIGVDAVFVTGQYGSSTTRIGFVDYVGQRTITLKAEVVSGTDVLAARSVDVIFGAGPISQFVSLPVTGYNTWEAANAYCTGLSATLPTLADRNRIKDAAPNAGWKGDRRYWLTNGNSTYFSYDEPDASVGYYTICKKP